MCVGNSGKDNTSNCLDVLCIHNVIYLVESRSDRNIYVAGERERGQQRALSYILIWREEESSNKREPLSEGQLLRSKQQSRFYMIHSYVRLAQNSTVSIASKNVESSYCIEREICYKVQKVSWYWKGIDYWPCMLAYTPLTTQ